MASSLTDWLTVIFEKQRAIERLVTFETFDQSGEETWPEQQKDKDKYNDKDI